MSLKRNLKEAYSPLYFLASLGAGGMTVAFFMYLFYFIPHKGSPIPRFEHLYAVMTSGGFSLQQLVVVVALAGIVFFAWMHFRLLAWNISEFNRFRRTKAHEKLRTTPAEVQLMAIPLTYAMAVNVGFILGALFVPGLWGVVEYLFPLALVAFGAIGIHALKIFTEFYSRVLTEGGFDSVKNNSLSQMLAPFAFSMIGVGFSAAGAMSHNHVTSAIGLTFALGFSAIALLLAVIKIVTGFSAMFEHGVNREAAVSLWIVIPILTVVGIALFRVSMGMHHNFGVHLHPAQNASMFAIIVSIQAFFGLLGHAVMKRIGYYETFISGEGKSPVAYAAICPGVAFFVMGNFFINFGLVTTGVLPKFSVAYFLFYLPLVYLQAKTIVVLFKLNNKLLKKQPEADAGASKPQAA